MIIITTTKNKKKSLIYLLIIITMIRINIYIYTNINDDTVFLLLL